MFPSQLQYPILHDVQIAYHLPGVVVVQKRHVVIVVIHIVVPHHCDIV